MNRQEGDGTHLSDGDSGCKASITSKKNNKTARNAQISETQNQRVFCEQRSSEILSNGPFQEWYRRRSKVLEVAEAFGKKVGHLALTSLDTWHQRITPAWTFGAAEIHSPIVTTPVELP